jgi:hypothetical protein
LRSQHPGEAEDGAPATFDNPATRHVGRKPNGKLIGAENAGVAVDERGATSTSMRTTSSTKLSSLIG